MSETGLPKKHNWLRWVGWVLSALPSMLLLYSGISKFGGNEEFKEQIEGHLGWPMRYMPALGIVETSITILFLIPQTSVLGAILITGYMGGAIATHARVGDPFILQALVGVVVWLGIYLRDRRLHPLMPIRKLGG